MNREELREILNKHKSEFYASDMNILNAMQEAVDLALQQSSKVPTKELKDINMDEYVRQTIQTAETKTGNDRFILIYGLFQEMYEKAVWNAEIRTKNMVKYLIEKTM